MPSNEIVKNFIDPNRDFPYISKQGNYSDACMKTLAGRTVNEIFREHLIINSITFHGGTNVIGYVWGNYLHIDTIQHKSTEAPDKNAAKSIAELLSLYSDSKSPNNNIPKYIVGDMTNTVLIYLIIYRYTK